MKIVEERYGRGATTITSQLPIKAWHDVVGELTFADAVLDRIVHNAYRLELEGQLCAKPSPNWMTKSLRYDTRKSLPYGNASQVAECVGTGGRMCWIAQPEPQEPHPSGKYVLEGKLEAAIAVFINHRYHESIGKLTPADF